MPILNNAYLSLKISVSTVSRITVKTLTMTAHSVSIWIIWFVIEHITYMRKIFILFNSLWVCISSLFSFPLCAWVIRTFIYPIGRTHRTSIFVISSLLSLNAFTIYLLVLELTLSILKTWNASKAISSSICTLHEVLISNVNVGVVMISGWVSWIALILIVGPIKVEQFESSFPIGSIKLCTTSGIRIKVMVNLIILFIFLKFSHKCWLLFNRI